MSTPAASLPLTADLDFVRAAHQFGMRVSVYWRTYVAPRLADPKTSPYVVHTLKKRALIEVKDLIPRAIEINMFNALLKDPATKAHVGRPLRMEYGVSREYISVRLIGYLERHIASGQPTPYPLSAYLANLIPNRVSDSTITYMVDSGEFPITMAGFKRDPIHNDHQLRALDVDRKRRKAKTDADQPKRWGEPITDYLADLEARRAAQFAAHADLLNATPTPSLKAFAKHLQATLPSKASKRMPHPGAVIQYIDRCLRSRIPATVYQELHQQATAYAVGAPIAIQQRLNSLV